MKKLTKMHLMELELRLPLIDELSQKTYVGGEAFYNIWGCPLGYRGGTSTEIRICEDSVFDSYDAILDSGSLAWGSVGDSLVSLSDDDPIKVAFFSNMAQNYGCDFDEFHLDNTLTSGVLFRTTNLTNGTHDLSMNSKESYNYDEKSLISSLQHEQYHSSDISDDQLSVKEVKAYYYQITQSIFYECDEIYQNDIIRSMIGAADICDAEGYLEPTYTGLDQNFINALDTGINAVRFRIGLPSSNHV